MKKEAANPTRQLVFGPRNLRKNSRGQIAVVLILAALAMVGAVALGTDIAVLYFSWVQLQKSVDSAALAGANYLPNDEDTAVSKATSYANGNGVLSTDTLTVTPIDPTNSTPPVYTEMQVKVARTVPYMFAQVLGLTNGQVSVSSIASIPYSPKTIGAPGSTIGCSGSCSGGGSGGTQSGGTPNPVCGNSTGQYDVIPIVVDNKTASQFVAGQSYTLNRGDGSGNGPWTDAPGNWGMASLCGESGGGAALRSSIADGFYGPISVGDTIQTDTGATVEPVSQGFGDRIGASTDAWGKNGNANTPKAFDPNDPRAVIVPMASFAGCTGSCTLTVTGFLAFYIDSYNGGAITGHFINKVQTNSIGVAGFAGDAGTSGDPILVN
jgi:hypothetical protein